MSAPSFQYNLITILGENVALTPTGLSPSETTIVEFDRYYLPPDISGNEALLLKNTMRQVFENKLKKVVNTDSGEELDDKVIQAFPPCGEEEKALVLKSLVHRKAVLEQQLFNIGIKTPEELRAKINEMAKTKKDEAIQGQDSMLARQHLVHYLRLKRFINTYNDQQYCIYLEDIAYGELQQELTDERVIELLKQFVFFVLQSHHPLDDYKKSDPTAPAFVSRLERHPLKEKFDAFLETYTDNDLPIPQAIASVLEATELSPEAMEDEIQRRVKKCRDDILKKIQTILPPADSFWKRVKDKTDLDSVLDALLQYPQDLLVEIKTLEAEKAALESKGNTADQAKTLLEQQKNALTKLVADLQAQLTKEKGKDAQIATLQQEKDDAVKQLNARQAELDTLRRQCDDRIRALEQRIQANQDQSARLTTDVEGLRRENDRLKAIADQATADVKGLQQQLQQQKDLVAEKEAARLAAENAAKASANDLAEKIQELAVARGEVTTQGATIQAKDNDINKLRKQIQAHETAAAALQDDLKGKVAELRKLNEQLGLSKEEMDALRDKIQTLSQAQTDSKLQDEANQADLATLRTQLADATRRAGDLEIQVAAAKKETEGLRGSVTGSKGELAKLTAELDAANQGKDQAVRERDTALTRIKSLEVALSDSQEEAKKQTGFVAERDAALKAKQGEFDAKASEEAAQRKRADAAEAKVEEVEAAKDALEASMGEQLQAVQTSLTQKFQGELAKAKEEFDSALAAQQSDLGSVAGKAKEAHQMLRDVVLAVASDKSTPESIAALGEVPEKNALDSIVTRLAAAAKPSGPLALAAERKIESSMQCYFVFFTSFLFQSNFPSMILNATTSPDYNQEKQMFNIFNSIFHTGNDPAVTTGKSPLGDNKKGLYAKYKVVDQKVPLIKEYFRVIQTLAKALESDNKQYLVFSKDAAQQAKSIEYTKALLNQVDEIGSLYTGKFIEDTSQSKPSTEFQEKALAAIYKSMNENERANYNAKRTALLAGKEKLSPEDIQKLVLEFVGDTTTAATTATSATTTASKTMTFAENVTKYLKQHQPTINEIILDKYIIADTTGIKIGEKNNLNYAVLFYCFLMLMRDYLISIENTGDQCQLPTFLKTFGK
ncbi:MAG: hypothetical protein EBU82_01250 [Flavobacteriia bacterium]|nr:hypothetical protein [Flavobacteriia bacterium]